MNRPKGEQTIFAEALRLPPQERAAYLTQSTMGNPELREEVESLLKSYAAGEFLEQAAAPEIRPTAQAAAAVTERPGDTIGRYKLLQQIGEGGCGVVYMAEQEEPFHRRVALKIIKLGMDTKSVIARFEAERQALAMMDHPNIARVLDAGATETGRPYFVMELVRGMKITDYCDEKKLPTRQRLDLFIQVCQAIQHAHQKGIIHRDIKPSNILVTINDGVPVPKVIDFGIAKATGGLRLTDRTLFTAFEQFIGTPAYMSPEQAVLTSLDIDTRSDIYALGVLLYELLTGKTPFDAKELLAIGLDEMRRTIREQEPPRPSTRLSTLPGQELSTTAQRRGLDAPKLVSELRGDLDWIVMKALEKDRTRRYETANGLAADVQRHLNNEPVVACPPSRLYRLRKTFRRNKLVFAACAAMLAALLVGLGTSMWMFLRERDARKRAVAAEHAQRKLRQESEAHAYASDVKAASHALEDGNLGLARTLLAAHVPLPGEKDLRGFEWRYLWLLSKGDELTVLRGHSNNVNCVAFSPDGKILASGSKDRTVKLWNADSGELLHTGGGHSRELISLAFSPDGKVLATGAQDNLVFLRDAHTLKILTALTNRSPRLAFSGRLLIIATGGDWWGVDGGDVKLWDYVARREIMTLPASGNRAAPSPDGTLLATANSEELVKLWELPSGRLLKSFRSPSVLSLSFSADGRAIAWWSGGPGLYLWELDQEQPKLISPKAEAAGTARGLAFAPDGKTFALGYQNHEISLWDAKTWRELRKFRGHGGEIASLVFSPDAGTIASGSFDGTVRLWDTGPPAGFVNVVTNVVLERSRNIGRPVFSPDGRRMAAALKGGGIRIFDVRTCRTESELDVQGLPVAYSSDGERLLIRNASFSHLQDWNVKTGSLQATVSIDETNLGSCDALSPDNRLIAATCRNPRRVVVRDAATGDVLRSFSGSASGLKFSSDARLLACGHSDGTATIYDLKTGEPWKISGFKNAVEAFAFSSDKTLLAVGSWDAMIKVYDLHLRRFLKTLTGHKAGVLRLEFSPDSKTLASCGDDATVRLWSPETGREFLTLKSRRSPTFIMFANDGSTLASGTGFHGEVEFWRAPSLSEVEAENENLSPRAHRSRKNTQTQ